MTDSIKIVKAFKPLFEPKRYKVMHGGRGGAKSHNVARALLLQGMQKPLRIICAREIQKSIKDSVHALLKDIIKGNEVSDAFYNVLETEIRGKNGTQILFRGLKHNTTDLKSLEGADIVWVEEAENVSDNSWEILIPTVRKEGSEIWVTFNPKRPDSPTYKRMVFDADENYWVREINYDENPFFPDTLRLEMEKLKKTDPKAYDHIWLGKFDERFTGFVYAELLKKVKENQRIIPTPYKEGVPVLCAWDLGNADSTSIWFAQKVGFEVRVIDFYENNMQPLTHYVDIINSKPYKNMVHYLPHDGSHERLGMKGSIKSQLKGLGLNCRTLANNTLESGISSARDLLTTCYFDDVKCKEGLHALSNYQYEYDEDKQKFKDRPRHDWSSHASDAFRYLAQALHTWRNDEQPKIIDPFALMGRADI